ncbi:MAG: beta-galactosidase [bacterium]|nr:beta-galactosidase [bacterium]
MKKFIKRILMTVLVVISGITLILTIFLTSVRNPQKPERFTYGITFSRPFTEKLGLDWKETYIAILDELNIKTIRLVAYWSEIEPREGNFDFEGLDWQISQAKKRNIGVMLAFGQKLPRWPECHYPAWLQKDTDEKMREGLDATEHEKLLRYLRATMEHYKDENAITHWQIENEPFLPFGICPVLNEDFFGQEVALVRSMEPSRSLVISESGEFSTWIGAARLADVIGSTLYRVVWWQSTGYVRYPIPEWFYWKKTILIKWLYPSVKDIVVIELQGEPWAHLQIYENTIEEMMKSMPPAQFIENLRYARDSRFATQYVWGAEWWYWMKTKHQVPFYWDYAGQIFKE